MNNKDLNPIKSPDREHSTGEYYWMCPKCKNRVGGFYITGKGFDDWGYKKDKFCSECGTQINWD